MAYGQPEPGTTKAARGRTVRLFKGVEQARNLRILNADSGITHREADLPIECMNDKPDVALPGEFHGIIKQVCQYLSQSQGITHDPFREFRAVLDSQVQALCQDRLPDKVQRFIDSGSQLKGGRIKMQFSCFQF